VTLANKVPSVVTLPSLPGGTTPADITTMAILGADNSLTPIPTRVVGGNVVVMISDDAILVPLSIASAFNDLQHVSAGVQQDIARAASLMIVEGFPGGAFRASEQVTTQQAVTMFLRAAGIPVDFATAMATGTSSGFIGSGLTGSDPMTRIATAGLIVNALRASGLEFNLSAAERDEILARFPDLAGLNAAQRDVLAVCVKLNIFRGHTDGTMGPSGILNRSQMASLAVRLQDVLLGLN